MKKWIVLMIAFAIVVCTGTAMAEGIELDNLSDDEIVILMGRIQEEIVIRHIERTATLAGGTYIAGEDLPAGSYILTCLATGDDWGNITIRSEGGIGEQLFWEVVSAPEEGAEPESFFITLNENDQLKSGVPFSLTVYTGVLFE